MQYRYHLIVLFAPTAVPTAPIQRVLHLGFVQKLRSSVLEDPSINPTSAPTTLIAVEGFCSILLSSAKHIRPVTSRPKICYASPTVSPPPAPHHHRRTVRPLGRRAATPVAGLRHRHIRNTTSTSTSTILHLNNWHCRRAFKASISSPQ